MWPAARFARTAQTAAACILRTIIRPPRKVPSCIQSLTNLPIVWQKLLSLCARPFTRSVATFPLQLCLVCCLMLETVVLIVVCTALNCSQKFPGWVNKLAGAGTKVSFPLTASPHSSCSAHSPSLLASHRADLVVTQLGNVTEGFYDWLAQWGPKPIRGARPSSTVSDL